MISQGHNHQSFALNVAAQDLRLIATIFKKLAWFFTKRKKVHMKETVAGLMRKCCPHSTLRHVTAVFV